MRYNFVFEKDESCLVIVFDTTINQPVIKLPRSVAEKTRLMYSTSIKSHGHALADEWMHGYVSGAIDTELILKGLVK